MSNINLSFINIWISPSIFISFLLGCTNLNTDRKDYFSIVVKEIIEQKQLEKYPIELKLDTTSHFQNKLIEPEDSLFFGNKVYLIHVSEGDGLGYVLFKDQNKFFVALIKWVDSYRVFGISEISGLRQGEEFMELLYSDLPITSITFGIIKKMDANVKTIMTWRINNSKMKIEEINPETVDFTQTYNADTD